MSIRLETKNLSSSTFIGTTCPENVGMQFTHCGFGFLQFSSVQSLSHFLLFATPWIAARQASLSITKSRSSLKLMSMSCWCHPAISSSVIPFSSCPQSLPVSGSFPMSQLFATPWITAHQASLSITKSQSLFKLLSIELVMLFNHLILSSPLLLLPSVFYSIRVFSNESVFRIRWPKYWSFSISPSNEYSGLISFF